jgi:hypothetical protein
MARRIVMMTLVSLLTILGIVWNALAQAPSEPPKGSAKQGVAKAGKAKQQRPPLFFREEWKQLPAGGENPLSQQHVANPNLELKVYGPASKELLVSGDVRDETNPVHAWTGMCTSPCAVAFREKTNYADLTGLARIRWVTKMSGYHQVRPIVKLADGTWLVGDRAEGSTVDWLESEVSLAELRWLRMDPERVVTTGSWVMNPDLSKVDEIGFVDLMPSSGHGQGGWADVGRFEVYGKAVAR